MRVVLAGSVGMALSGGIHVRLMELSVAELTCVAMLLHRIHVLVRIRTLHARPEGKCSCIRIGVLRVRPVELH